MKLFYLCIKDNPIRVYNETSKLITSYSFKNNLEETISPICLKVDQYGMNLFCGGNKFFFKIDLNTDKISQLLRLRDNSNNEDKTVISCFDFNYKLNFYLCGTYSKNIYLLDHKANKPIEIINNNSHTGGINCLKFLNRESNNIYFLSGARKDDKILLWDIRNTTVPVLEYYRKNQTNQKLKFEIDSDDKYLFVPNCDGTALVYSLNANETKVISYFYASESADVLSSIDYHSDMKLMMTTTGTRQFNIDMTNQEQTIGNDKLEAGIEDYKGSDFRFWDMSSGL